MELSTDTDYLIVGAGPAGLDLALALTRAGLAVRVLEAGARPGTSFRRFPRHRTLISSNKVHTGCSDAETNLRMDWNSLLGDSPEHRFTTYSKAYFPHADDYVRYLGDFADRHQIPVTYDTRVERIRRAGSDRFLVADSRGRVHHAKRVIVATGVARPYVPAIPGIEKADVYTDVSVDPDDFRDKRVLILGKGNSAFETAENLIATAAVIHVAGPGSLKFAWKTHYVGHLRAVNNNFLDTYQLKSQNAILDGTIRRVERDERDENARYQVTFRFSRSNEVEKVLTYDRVIVCTGFRFDASIFDEECRPALVFNDRFPAQTPDFESTNVPGLYFAGTLMQVRDFKKSTNGFIHGFRYSVRALSRILQEKHEGRPWPARELALEAGALERAILGRANRSSGLWQQFGVLADVVQVEGSGRGRAMYCEECPLDRVRETTTAESWFSLTLEYGPDHDKHDPFDVDVGRAMQNDPARAHEGQYLHPVIRHYHRSELVAVHHVAENLENDWTGDEAHRAPLRAFFARQLGLRQAPERGDAHATLIL